MEGGGGRFDQVAYVNCLCKLWRSSAFCWRRGKGSRRGWALIMPLSCWQHVVFEVNSVDLVEIKVQWLIFPLAAGCFWGKFGWLCRNPILLLYSRKLSCWCCRVENRWGPLQDIIILLGIVVGGRKSWISFPSEQMQRLRRSAPAWSCPSHPRCPHTPRSNAHNTA